MAETTGSVTPAKAGGVAPGPQSGTGCGFAQSRQVAKETTNFLLECAAMCGFPLQSIENHCMQSKVDDRDG